MPPPLRDPEGVPELVEPIAPHIKNQLRTAVAALCSDRRRRRFPATIHVGTPGDIFCSFTDDEEHLDIGLRTAIVEALMSGVSPPQSNPLCWLSRPGELRWNDTDAAWLGPVVRAFAAACQPLTMVVVTRRGWYDPRSGVTREWKRLRSRRAPESTSPIAEVMESTCAPDHWCASVLDSQGARREARHSDHPSAR
jgi:hypothetical protein